MNTSPSAQRPARLSWKARFLLLAFGVFLIFAVLEAALRISAVVEARRARPDLNAKSGAEFWAIYDPDLGYRQNPNYGDMNSDGLRDHPIGPKGNRARVLLLGDSVAVYGDNVDDTFVGHMRAELARDASAPPVEVINAGVKGYTNYQELQYLKQFGLKFSPDIVGVEFCLNDLHNFLHSFRVENGKLVPGTYQFSTDALQEARDWPRRLARRSYLLVWARSKFRVARDFLDWQASGGFSFDYNATIRTAWRDESWTDIERQMMEMVALGRQHGFRVFLTVVPLQVQYDAQYLARDRAHVLKPQRKLKEICARLQIPFFDLYPHMDGSMFIEDGIHLTQPGRRRVGQSLAAFLKESALLAAPVKR